MRARAYNPDDYYAHQFLWGIYTGLIQTVDVDFATPSVPQFARLAGLALVAHDEIFRLGLAFAIRAAHRDAPILSQPVYRHQFIKQFEEVGRAAFHLQELLNSLVDPKNHTSLWVGKALGHSVNIVLNEHEKAKDFKGEKYREYVRRTQRPLRPFLPPLATLAQASRSAKMWAHLYGIKIKGRPRGFKGCGAALTRFIAHLEFAARAAGGRWTLNKNDERGSLIDALEILRASLPNKFLPPKGRHPYSSYQNVLTLARSEWKKRPSYLIQLITSHLARMDQK